MGNARRELPHGLHFLCMADLDLAQALGRRQRGQRIEVDLWIRGSGIDGKHFAGYERQSAGKPLESAGSSQASGRSRQMVTGGLR